MRLDQVVTPPLVDKAPVVTLKKIPQAGSPADSGPSKDQGEGRARLGQIIDLLEKQQARDKKKKSAPVARQEALKRYQKRLSDCSPQILAQSNVGQNLDIKA